MSENKRYYWLRLKDDFFEQREIKKLRKVAGGDTYTIIYLKLQLLSLKTEGNVFFEGTEEDIYEQISLELDEEIENVKMTLMFLQKNRMVSIDDNQDLIMNETKELIGTETASTIRSRKSREKSNIQEVKALQCNTDATKCNGEKEKEKEKDIRERDKEKNIYTKKESLSGYEFAVEVESAFQKFIDCVEVKNGKRPNAHQIQLHRKRLLELSGDDSGRVEILNYSAMAGWGTLHIPKEIEDAKKGVKNSNGEVYSGYSNPSDSDYENTCGFRVVT